MKEHGYVTLPSRSVGAVLGTWTCQLMLRGRQTTGCSCPDLAQAYLGFAQILHLQGGAVSVLLVFASPCPFLVSTSLALWALALSVSLSSLGE